MDFLLFPGYELLTVLIPVCISWLLYQKRRSPSLSRSKHILTAVFALYIFAVFHVTGTGTLYDALLYRLEFRPEQLNLIPFSDGVGVTGYLNILLFVPFGLLIPLLWARMDHPAIIVCSGFGFSLLIELSQLLNNRRTDIDDLLLNTLGALIGYAVFTVILKIRGGRRATPSPAGYMLFVFILAAFLGHFFLYNDMGLAKLLYGF